MDSFMLSYRTSSIIGREERWLVLAWGITRGDVPRRIQGVLEDPEVLAVKVVETPESLRAPA
jgi:hypothetical protein